MHRFYVKPEQVEEEKITIEGGDVNHIRNVLRLSAGDTLLICDGNNTDYYCRIEKVEAEAVPCRIEKVQATGAEPAVKAYLFQGLPKGDKMELIIQKAVELGVAAVIPVLTERSVVKLDEKKAGKKRERWQKIAESAAKQCGRGVIPNVEMPVDLQKAFDMAGALEYNIMPYECAEGMAEAGKSVSEAAKKKTVGIFIGPEGGFAKEEAEAAKERGIRLITLGKRILRTETAGLAMLAILMFQVDLGHAKPDGPEA